MTTITLYPRGFEKARQRAYNEYANTAGMATDELYRKLVLEELKTCPDLSGKYQKERQAFEVKQLNNGAFLMYETAKGLQSPEFSGRTALEHAKELGDFKKDQKSLKELCEIVRLKTEPGASIEYWETPLFYDVVRDLKSCAYLKAGIEGEKAFLEAMAGSYDENLYGSFIMVNGGQVRHEDGRIFMSYNENYKNKGVDLIMVVAAERQRSDGKLEPITHREWLLLTWIAKFFDAQNPPFENPKLQIREFDGKYLIK